MASSPIEAPRRSKTRLKRGRGAGQVEAPDPHQGDAVEVVELDRRADDLEQARQHADAHADGLQRPYEVEHLARVDAARGDDRAVHVERLGEVADLGQARLRRSCRWTTARPCRGPGARRRRRLTPPWPVSFERIVSAESSSPMNRQRSIGAMRSASSPGAGAHERPAGTPARATGTAPRGGRGALRRTARPRATPPARTASPAGTASAPRRASSCAAASRRGRRGRAAWRTRPRSAARPARPR